MNSTAPPDTLRLTVTGRHDRDAAPQLIALCRGPEDRPGLIIAAPSRAEDLLATLRGGGLTVAHHPDAAHGVIAVGAGPPRFILHEGAPANLADYCADLATLADVADAEGILVTAPTDFARARAAAGNDLPALHAIDAVQGYTEWAGCRHQALQGHFGTAHSGDCGNCDNCLSPPPGVIGAEDARHVIDAVVATGERFSPKHVVGVLRGERTETVSTHQHDRLDVWRSGAELSRAGWDSVIRQLVCAGVLAFNDDGGLVTTPLAGDVRSGARTIRFTRHLDLPDAPMPKRRGVPATKPATRTSAARTANSSRPRATSARPSTSARATEEAKRTLYRWRTAYANELGVPPIRILTDPDIGKLAVRRPTSRDELRLIITPSRVDAYGEAILAALADL